jgi:hypothetical protein
VYSYVTGMKGVGVIGLKIEDMESFLSLLDGNDILLCQDDNEGHRRTS